MLDQRVSERTFQAKMERRLAVLVGEGLGLSGGRRMKRATAVGNNSVQVLRQQHKYCKYSFRCSPAIFIKQFQLYITVIPNYYY